MSTTELARQIAVLEERMETRKAEFDSEFAKLREDIAKRDRDNIRWQIGLWVAAIAVLGFVLRFPVS